jgi:hypothetical protein
VRPGLCLPIPVLHKALLAEDRVDWTAMKQKGTAEILGTWEDSIVPGPEIDSWEILVSWALKGCAAPQVSFHSLSNIARLRYRHPCSGHAQVLL